MRIVSWNWFWYVVLGFLMGGGAIWIRAMLKEKGLKFKWYELLLTMISFLTFMFLGQTFIGSFAEQEPRAAWLSVVFLGLPIVIMAVVVVRSVRARLTAAGA